MRFLIRGLGGLLTLAAAAGLIGLGAAELVAAFSAEEDWAGRAAAERVVAAPVAVLTPASVAPRIEAHGVVRSWRTMELRAPTPGRIVSMAERFRDGVEVRADALLALIDPADYEAAVAEAEAAVAEAEADIDEALQGVVAAGVELAAAETRQALSAGTLERRRGLSERGVAAAAAVDEAAMEVAAAEQTAASRRQAVATAELRVARARLARRRAELALEEARRALADTRVTAPFDGVLTEVTADLGEIASTNEALGALVDPTALEVSFRVSNAEFARLIGDDGALLPLDVAVRLPLGGREIEARATLDRANARIGAGRTGRELFARLEETEGLWLRPDAFVTVTIEEPALENVAAIPVEAATEDGRILLLEDGRLREIRVTVLRRERDRLIVGGAPFGATYVVSRGPQLADGLKARPAATPRAVAAASPESG